MFDITKHKFIDCFEKVIDGGGKELIFKHHCATKFSVFNKDDAIAIAKHFGIIQEIDGQRITIYKAEISLIPQSETTYNSKTNLKAEGFNQNG